MKYVFIILAVLSFSVMADKPDGPPGLNKPASSTESFSTSGADAEATSVAGAIAAGLGVGIAEGDYSSTAIDIDNTRVESAHSASSLHSSGCQVGVSAQVRGGGVSMIVDDAVCQSLKMADAHEYARGHCPGADKECIAFHDERVSHFLEQAGDAVDDTSTTNTIAKNATNAAIGGIGIGILAWLIILI